MGGSALFRQAVFLQLHFATHARDVPAFTSPAFSTPGNLVRVFQSRLFHPCDLVPRFPVLRFPPPYILWSRVFQSRVFSVPVVTFTPRSARSLSLFGHNAITTHTDRQTDRQLMQYAKPYRGDGQLDKRWATSDAKGLVHITWTKLDTTVGTFTSHVPFTNWVWRRRNLVRHVCSQWVRSRSRCTLRVTNSDWFNWFDLRSLREVNDA